MMSGRIRWVPPKSVFPLIFFAMSLVYCLALTTVVPIATNDGPIHMGFGNFLASGEAQPALGKLYEHNPRFSPNFLIYAIIPGLLGILPAAAVEALIQLGYLLGLAAAMYFACRQVNPARGWVAVFALPLALNQMFFLGLYNYCYSIVGFVLAVGCWFRQQRRPVPGNVLATIASLYFTFFAHASGFIAALLAAGVLFIAQMAKDLPNKTRPGQLIRLHSRGLLVLASSLPLLYLMLANQTPSETTYGPGLLFRILTILRSAFLYVGHAHTGIVVLGIAGIFSAGIILLAWQVYAARRCSTIADVSVSLSVLALWLAMVCLALAFPDVMGGGWTHFRRMALFPACIAILGLARIALPPKMLGLLAAIGMLSGASLLAGVVTEQLRIQKQMGELAVIDRHVGAHCVVLPVVLEVHPIGNDGKPILIDYDPFFQSASRLELSKDRPVLFNFLARLEIYPVRFKQQKDPQQLLFHWKPNERDIYIQTLDVAQFENVSGIPVDYILQWGKPESTNDVMRNQLKAALAGTHLVYRSATGHVMLFRKKSRAGSSCTDL